MVRLFRFLILSDRRSRYAISATQHRHHFIKQKKKSKKHKREVSEKARKLTMLLQRKRKKKFWGERQSSERNTAPASGRRSFNTTGWLLIIPRVQQPRNGCGHATGPGLCTPFTAKLSVRWKLRARWTSRTRYLSPRDRAPALYPRSEFRWVERRRLPPRCQLSGERFRVSPIRARRLNRLLS